jgi:hypothetical protein
VHVGHAACMFLFYKRSHAIYYNVTFFSGALNFHAEMHLPKESSPAALAALALPDHDE